MQLLGQGLGQVVGEVHTPWQWPRAQQQGQLWAGRRMGKAEGYLELLGYVPVSSVTVGRPISSGLEVMSCVSCSNPVVVSRVNTSRSYG